MNTWYLYAERFYEIEKIPTHTYISLEFHIEDTNLVYSPMILGIDCFLLEMIIDDKRRLFYIEDIITKLSEEETYQRVLDLYGYLRLKYST